MLSTWEHHVPTFTSDDWVILDIDAINFSGAVTLVATVSATVPEGKAFNDPPPHRFEYGLTWLVQDSLNGKDWHRLGGGRLRNDLSQDVARVSSPMGTRARLCFRPSVLAAMDPQGRTYQAAEGWQHLWTTMDLARPTDVRADIAVRSI